jgi:hypothetical protein
MPTDTRSALLNAAEALKPFADVNENDIGTTETDEDMFMPMTSGYNCAPRIRVGHMRAAATALAAVQEALDAPDLYAIVAALLDYEDGRDGDYTSTIKAARAALAAMGKEG